MAAAGFYDATNGAGPAARTTPTKKTTPSNTRQSGAPVLRATIPPVNQLDYADRHDTRATASEEMAQRYAELRRDQRRNDWHYLAMGLVVFVVGVTVYLASFVVVSRLLPYLNPREVTQIVGLASVAAGGGVAIRSAGRALKQHYARSRGQGSKSA